MLANQSDNVDASQLVNLPSDPEITTLPRLKARTSALSVAIADQQG